MQSFFAVVVILEAGIARSRNSGTRLNRCGYEITEKGTDWTFEHEKATSQYQFIWR
jgi:hypothetical protein